MDGAVCPDDRRLAGLRLRVPFSCPPPPGRARATALASSPCSICVPDSIADQFPRDLRTEQRMHLSLLQPYLLDNQ